MAISLWIPKRVPYARLAQKLKINLTFIKTGFNKKIKRKFNGPQPKKLNHDLTFAPQNHLKIKCKFKEPRP